jgi:phosphate transport system permease protein
MAYRGLLIIGSERMTQKSVQQLIDNAKNRRVKKVVEKVMPALLFLAAVISVLTTLGILFTLIFETFEFFNRVSFAQFLGETKWLPFSSKEPLYGIWPLVLGTLKVTFIAVLVAIPLGLGAAIYLSEFASDKVRRIIKPILEVLAGVPTIIYGFFALTFITPMLQTFIPELKIFNAISPGIVIGIMIIPMIASLSEDAMTAVPRAVREGAIALGATKFEVSIKVVLPAAISGIVASIVLAISRAIGETMIVSLAGGSLPRFDAEFTDSIQTMTAYIVQVATGDASYGSTIYYSIYAVGFTLFIFTLLMNLLASRISKRFREEY